MSIDTPIVPVILAGGSGTRLWPLSRNSLPKQFIALTSDKTLYQETLLRVAPGPVFNPPVIVTNDDFRFFALRQAREIGIEPNVLLEPTRRDSGPALIAAAAFVRKQYGPDCLVLALAADHAIANPEAFRKVTLEAAKAASLGHIVTYGITPTEPRTGYGYIHPGAPIEGTTSRTVAAFVEKPNRETAERYLAEGYLWNSGNFLFPAGLLVSECEAFAPDIAEAAVASAQGTTRDLDFIRLDEAAFAASPAKSIDYAVLEHTKRAAVVEGDFGWSDIGAWDAVYEISGKDDNGNAAEGPVVLLDTKNSYVRSEGPLLATVGMEGIAVVATDDAVLVMPADRSQNVKELVSQLKAAKRNEADAHLKIHLPWGTYETICQGERFLVKKIVVEPGGKLSLQKHHHRAEHWVVVRGTAEVTVGDKTFTVNENESTYLPLGAVHRLANPGRIPLELIEVQTGSYLGEDDIVRFEDIYRRV